MNRKINRKGATPAHPVAKAPVKTPPTHWGNVAQWYDELVGDHGSQYHQHVVLPGAIRLLGLKPGDKAVDVACGQGVLCRILNKGSVQTTGIDAAGEMIRLARQRSDAAIKFIKGDARELAFLPANHFDAAAIILAIQNIHPLPPVFQGVARCLVELGRLVIVMMHPCFRSPKAASWGYDEQARIQYRRVDRYLLPRKEPIVTHPGSDPGHYTWTFHRPIQQYVKALAGAGLLVNAMEEWPSHKTSEQGPRSAAENQARKEIPMFLAIRAMKVSAPLPTSTF
jgi:ubiquinone/menaquinone biosynthesis C-methylase UbiE